MKKMLLIMTLFIGIISINAQTVDELKATLAVQKDSLKAAQSRVNATQSKIEAFPGWKKGAFGTIGGSVSNFKNWYSQGVPNNSSGNIGFTVNAFANLEGYNVIIIIPLAAIVGVFLYVRASTMVPIATALIAKGMTMGSVISLTIAGAGASLPEMIMMKRMFHWPLMFAFIFVVFATACITGFAIELI